MTFAVKPEGRFEGVEWFSNVTGAPLLRGSIVHVESKLWFNIEAGDHGRRIKASIGYGSSGFWPAGKC